MQRSKVLTEARGRLELVVAGWNFKPSARGPISGRRVQLAGALSARLSMR